MTSRRAFVKSAALASAGALVSPRLLAAAPKYFGLQLYTVREAMRQDPAGTLTKVAQLGYNSVEGATYTGTQKFYGFSPADFAKLLHDKGLLMPSSHYVLGEALDNGQPTQGSILHDWDKAVDDAAQVGLKYMVCSYLQESERGNLDHYKQVAEHLNKAGKRCKKAGIQLCYHNHDFEFATQGGVLPYNILLNYTDKEMVKMELDLYWATKAGHDPLLLFQNNPGRFPLWHVKDMGKPPIQDFTEVGNGTIDFKKIFAHSMQAGMQYFFVEQDRTPGSPFDSIQQNLSYLKKTLI
ncbi:MAG: sugar phosphate isomerase/epimerase family protein [Janthinobacterium lividum]